jgi:DNA-binding transcriptional regulator GbsR (MarR family)
MTDTNDINLTPVMRKFILHWGEMGARWGINRTVAQIHALLYVTGQPLDAEAISQTLSVARSNVSNSLHELQTWGIVRVVHLMGDRRDRFESLQDVWELFRVIMDERKKRECDPTVKVLRECLDEARSSEDALTADRLGKLTDFFETMTSWYMQMRPLPTPALRKFLKLGDRIVRLVRLSK